MFINLSHQQLDIYKLSKELVYECYTFAKLLPVEERYGIISQIKRAAVSVHLNIAEGFSRKSPLERSRFHEIARGSLIEMDAALDIAFRLNFFRIEEAENFGRVMISCFKLLTRLIAANR